MRQWSSIRETSEKVINPDIGLEPNIYVQSPI